MAGLNYLVNKYLNCIYNLWRIYKYNVVKLVVHKKLLIINFLLICDPSLEVGTFNGKFIATFQYQTYQPCRWKSLLLQLRRVHDKATFTFIFVFLFFFFGVLSGLIKATLYWKFERFPCGISIFVRSRKVTLALESSVFFYS